MKTLFLVDYCDKKCQYPENKYCFTLSGHSRFRCVKCEVKELTEKWVCDECQVVKSGFDEYYELPEVPHVKSKLAETMIRIPSLIHIKKLCKSCYKRHSIMGEEGSA